MIVQEPAYNDAHFDYSGSTGLLWDIPVASYRHAKKYPKVAGGLLFFCQFLQKSLRMVTFGYP